MCDLSTIAAIRNPVLSAALNKQHAQPSSVGTPVLPLVAECRTSALTEGPWEQPRTGMSASKVELATAALRPALSEPVIASSLRKVLSENQESEAEGQAAAATDADIRTPNPEKLSNGTVAYGPYDIPENA